MNIRGAMLRALAAATLAVGMAASAPAAPLTQAAGPGVVVEKFSGSLLGTMREADKLGFAGRVQRLTPAVDEAFDIPAMTKLAVGPRWASLNEEQRARLTDAFHKFIVATYASRFDGYSDERFVVTRTTPTEDGTVVVESQMLRGEGEPVAFNYVLRQAGDGWRIGDILFGPISELANRRAEFGTVLRRDGYDGLIAELNRKIAQLKQP